MNIIASRSHKRYFRFARQIFILLLFYPWMIGCQRTLLRHDESWIEAMGGSGRMTQTIYYIPPGSDCGPQAIGRYDVQFGDGGIRASHYDANNGIVIDGGAGFVTTLKQSSNRWYSDTTTTPNVGVKNSYYGFLDLGYDADYYGWRAGVFFADSLHYQGPVVAPIIRFRFGALEKIHGEFGLMRNPTYLSSGSIFDAGLFFPVTEIYSILYIGMGASTGYASGQLLGQIEFQASNNIAIKATGNLGVLNGDKMPDDPTEYGFGIGIKYRW